MPRKRRRSLGEGGVRKRQIKRADGSTYTRYSAILTTGWADGTQKRLEGPRRETEREALQDLKDLNRQKD